MGDAFRIEFKIGSIMRSKQKTFGGKGGLEPPTPLRAQVHKTLRGTV